MGFVVAGAGPVRHAHVGQPRESSTLPYMQNIPHTGPHCSRVATGRKQRRDKCNLIETTYTRNGYLVGQSLYNTCIYIEQPANMSSTAME